MIELLQWLGGAGGVALLTLLFNQFNSKKSSEQSLIQTMSEQISLSIERYDKLVARVDRLEEDNASLRNDNINISYAKTQIIAEKDRMEQDLAEKIDKLTKENRTLKRRIKELETELEKRENKV
nr:MAG TPA: DNA REPAIR PROTEIN XRCC4, DNA end joining, double-strand break.3A [Caudoviricetes sp.]